MKARINEERQSTLIHQALICSAMSAEALIVRGVYLSEW